MLTYPSGKLIKNDLCQNLFLFQIPIIHKTNTSANSCGPHQLICLLRNGFCSQTNTINTHQRRKQKKQHLINYNCIASFIFVLVVTPFDAQYKCTLQTNTHTHTRACPRIHKVFLIYCFVHIVLTHKKKTTWHLLHLMNRPPVKL